MNFKENLKNLNTEELGNIGEEKNKICPKSLFTKKRRICN